jgi:hypothetical protein
MSSAAELQFQKDGSRLPALRVPKPEPEQRSDGLDVLSPIGPILVPRLFGHPPRVQFEVGSIDCSKTTDRFLEPLERCPLDLAYGDSRVSRLGREAEAALTIEEPGSPRQFLAIDPCPAFVGHASMVTDGSDMPTSD